MKILMKVISLLLFLTLFGGAAWAYNATGNPNDVPTGTNVKFHGHKNTVDFLNPNSTSEATVTTATLEFTVTTEAGLSSVTSPASLYQYSTPGVPVTWEAIVTNEGNTAVTLSMTKESFVYAGGASNWTTQFYNGASWVSSISQAIADDSDYSLKIRIVPSSIEAQSPNASTGTVTFYGTTGFPEPAGGGTYTGVNGLTYAGWTNTSGAAMVEIQAPLMTLTRAMTVDAPSAYTGNPHDPVPGAVMTFTITYSNTGNANATDAIIVDKVPTDTQGVHVNRTASEVSNVAITAARGTAASWEVFYSTGTPSFTYGDQTGWTLLGTLEPTSNNWALPNTATYIKWEKAAVLPSEDGKTMTWGVTIK